MVSSGELVINQGTVGYLKPYRIDHPLFANLRADASTGPRAYWYCKAATLGALGTL
ncbi:hypothetical protein M0657_010252 [Pyricularia oryzae]|uniref:Uncharacterized protein n=3 Tax=Pyricularia oryzae TaxID=318829 RepID=A0A4V1C7R0_PYROR|nr:hypothetical protein OOU_Y34scaffold00015g8 [Pyricularia oryzae Y34]KAI7911894.1 hypothetical protein M9X92_010313 [Pyricularia oryzae]KAI7912912.1 hypothetical protein M0657_010252 [Pyricularia oryzae]QBZ64258.1 hypothetical protein PoMZ_05953 [Pyricularia oryzae]